MIRSAATHIAILSTALALAWPSDALAHSDSHSHAAADGTTARKTVPLYENLGDHQYAITTRTPQAQRYFDQGLRLYYAFNHQEAIRAFENRMLNQR